MAQTPQEIELTAAYLRRHVHASQELAKLDGVIRLFDPAYQVGDIPAKRAKQRSNLFTPGELGQAHTGLPQEGRGAAGNGCRSRLRGRCHRPGRGREEGYGEDRGDEP